MTSTPRADQVGGTQVGLGQLSRLTAAKAVANVGARWVPFFLPTLATALSATTRQLTAVLGLAEMAGLGVLTMGRHLDRGRERLAIVASMGLVALGASLSLAGRVEVFAAGHFITLVGVALCTVAGHTWLSRRVVFTRRARAIGLFEISWALALLIGAPVAALLIGWVGWRGPFAAVAAAAAVLAVILALDRDDPPVLPDATALDRSQRIDRGAWVTIAASATIGVTGLTTIVIAGTWLDEALGVSTGGVGLVAMAFGAAELMASSGSAAVADRIGPNRATRIALVVAATGLVVMTRAGDSLPIGASGLFLFFVGFEFAIVTSFSIVSEAMPSARGRVLATNVAVGTLFRGAGVMSSGTLYEAFGIGGPAGLSLLAAGSAVALLTVAASRSTAA